MIALSCPCSFVRSPSQRFALMCRDGPGNACPVLSGSGMFVDVVKAKNRKQAQKNNSSKSKKPFLL